MMNIFPENLLPGDVLEGALYQLEARGCESPATELTARYNWPSVIRSCRLRVSAMLVLHKATNTFLHD